MKDAYRSKQSDSAWSASGIVSSRPQTIAFGKCSGRVFEFEIFLCIYIYQCHLRKIKCKNARSQHLKKAMSLL